MMTYGHYAFRIIDDIYYVGSQQVSSHLITTSEGHILIDTCMPETAPSILKSITDLGFDSKDIKYILITHAHIDHLGSVKMISEETGADICIGEADVEAAERGSIRRLGLMGFAPFKVDKALKEGDKMTLGNKEIHVYHTPGHTPGCCSFGFKIYHEGYKYEAFLFGGAGQNVFEEENLQKGIYGGTLQDYRKTLDRLENFQIDVWLGNHPEQNNTFGKLDLLNKGVTPNPYIDSEGWKAFLRRCKDRLQRFL